MIATSEDQMLQAFRDTVPYRPECENCGEKFFRKQFEKTLKETGVLEQVESKSELTYLECPNCGTPQDFSLN
jgi:DNA-directed RNA polymerase subunit RPC12/RpoP